MVDKEGSIKFDKKPISGFNNDPIKFKDPIIYPQPKDPNLPNNFFTCLCIGSTGSGKTFSVVKLLTYYHEKGIYSLEDGVCIPQRVIIFAPTFDSNPIYNALPNLDIENDVHMTYSDKLLQDVLDDIETVKEEADKYKEFKLAYKHFLKVKKMTELSNREIILLNMYDFDIKNFPKPKYERPPVNHIIFDDLISTSAYKANGSSLLSNLSVRNRHRMCNLYFLAQSVKQIPKIIRTQARLLMIYRYNSKTIVADLYEIVSGALTPEQFEKIYFDATEEKYTFLTIDNTHNDLQIKQNFDSLITLPTKKKEVEPEKKEKVRKKIVVDLAKN